MIAFFRLVNRDTRRYSIRLTGPSLQLTRIRFSRKKIKPIEVI